MRAASLLVVLLLIVLSACTNPSSHWWMFQADPFRTGLYPGASPIVPLHLKWSTSPVAGRSIDLTPPVFGEGKILIGSGYGDGKLYALSPQNGSILWSFAAHPYTAFYSAPAAANGTVYAVTLGGTPHVYALRQANGALVWQRPLPVGSIMAGVAAAGGRIFVNSSQHRLYALDQSTGAILWSAPTGPGISQQFSSPAVLAAGLFLLSGKVFVTSDDGLYAFDVTNGNLAWKFALPSSVSESSPVIHVNVPPGNPVLVFVTAGGTIYAVRESNGTLAWSYTSPLGTGGGTVGLAGGKVFFSGGPGLIALDANTGAVVWTYSIPGGYLIPPAIANGVLYYSDLAQVHGIQVTTGMPVWSHPIPGNGSPAASGSTAAVEFELLVVPNKGYVYAFTGP